MTRTRRGRHQVHDDGWGRRPPAATPSPPGPSRPAEPPKPADAPGLAGPPSRPAAPPGQAGPGVPVAATAAGPATAPNGDASAAPSRPPRPAISFERPAGGWAVEAHGLTKRFGATVAVNDVELLVPRGCAFGYLGPNGAGKTTLIRTLLGLTRADAGTMSLLGIPVPANRSRALARVGAIVDEPRFHPHLTGRDNLRLLAAARGGGAGERIAPSLERVGLGERADHKVGSYSLGMRQRLGVASCLLGDPELLILDEPMNGLDPAGMHQMRLMITGLVDEGRTVVLSSHLLDEVERTCDAVAIVDRGRVVRQGPIDELIRGAGTLTVQVDCADPARAARVIDEAGIAAGTSLTGAGLTVTLPAGASRELVADINRRLVGAGISVYGLQEIRASLEDWFLSVTTRLGENP
ncbi:MAG TPA: ATP-binding cassette domain-containing protein [Streptosporangiaceae bacterium]|nr:ATP-binding cassette domain-containing protein [Streptosporangiaceae bacterium]